jgi:hypothetical protein
MIKGKNFGSKYVNILKTILSAEAHLAQRQFLLEHQTLKIEYSLICRTEARRLTVSKRKR